MKIDEWTGCYPSNWKGKIVPDAITHPAKYSSKLIRRIYEHMLEENWLKPGDLVIDPFGGVALGALDAMRLGLRWRGVELEPRFAELGNMNIALWNSRFSRMPNWCSDATLLQGDSRHLLEVLAQADGAVSSPPYAESMNQSSGANDTDARIERMRKAGIDVDNPVNVGGPNGVARKPQTYAAGAVSSPPYAESVNSGGAGIDWDKANHPDRNTTQAKGIQGANGHEMKYGATPGQLGAMKANGFDGAVSSPPYSESDQNYKEGWKRFHDHHDPLWKNDRQREAEYGATPGQLGAMKANGFDASVASPPFRQTSGGTGETAVGRGDPNLLKRHGAGNANAKAYGETNGQLANMQDGDFEGAVSSPPFGAAMTGGGIAKKGYQNESARKGSQDHPFDLVGKRSYMPENQGIESGNLANDSGDDFWTAARTIVEQVYIALRPGGHACWVVKGFVKNKELVDFPGQWRQLCEAVGFETLHEHHAMLVRHNGTSHTLEGGTVEHITESKSFFRRLAEKKGSPRIDFETVLCMMKP